MSIPLQDHQSRNSEERGIWRSQELASKAEQTAGTTGATESRATLVLHVHLQGHFGGGVDGGLLVTGL